MLRTPRHLFVDLLKLKEQNSTQKLVFNEMQPLYGDQATVVRRYFSSSPAHGKGQSGHDNHMTKSNRPILWHYKLVLRQICVNNYLSM